MTSAVLILEIGDFRFRISNFVFQISLMYTYFMNSGLHTTLSNEDKAVLFLLDGVRLSAESKHLSGLHRATGRAAGPQ